VWFSGRGGTVSLPRAAAFVDDADITLAFICAALEIQTSSARGNEASKMALRDFVAFGGLELSLKLAQACPRFGVVFARCMSLDCNTLVSEVQRRHSGGASSLLEMFAKFASSQLLRAAAAAAESGEVVVFGGSVAALLAGAVAMPPSQREAGVDFARSIMTLLLALPYCFTEPANATAFARAGLAEFLNVAWETSSLAAAQGPPLCDLVGCTLLFARSAAGIAAIAAHAGLARAVLEAVLLYAADASVCMPAGDVVLLLARAPEAARIWSDARVPAAAVAAVAAGDMPAALLASGYAASVAPGVASGSLYAWATARQLGAALPSLAVLGASTVADLATLTPEDVDGAALPVVLSRRLKAALGFAGSTAEPGPAKMEIEVRDLAFDGDAGAGNHAGGHFSDVVRARWKRRTVVAVKTLKSFAAGGGGRAGIEAVHELRVMSRLWNHEVSCWQQQLPQSLCDFAHHTTSSVCVCHVRC
jgi:hypothetical protein